MGDEFRSEPAPQRAFTGVVLRRPSVGGSTGNQRAPESASDRTESYIRTDSEIPAQSTLIRLAPLLSLSGWAQRRRLWDHVGMAVDVQVCAPSAARRRYGGTWGGGRTAAYLFLDVGGACRSARSARIGGSNR